MFKTYRYRCTEIYDELHTPETHSVIETLSLRAPAAAHSLSRSAGDLSVTAGSMATVHSVYRNHRPPYGWAGRIKQKQTDFFTEGISLMTDSNFVVIFENCLNLNGLFWSLPSDSFLKAHV